MARATGADSSLLVEEAAQALAMFARYPQALLVACKQLLSRQPMVGGLWWLCSRMLTATDPLAEARAVVTDSRTDQTASTLLKALRDHEGEEADGEWPRVLVAGWPDSAVNALAESLASVLVVEVDGVGHGVVRRLERSGVDAEVVPAERVVGAVSASDVVVVEAAAASDSFLSSAVVEVGSLLLVAAARAQGKPVWLVCPPSRVVPESLWPDVEAGHDRWLGPEWMAPTELLPLASVDVAICGDELVEDIGQSLGSGLVGGWSAAPELVGVVRPTAT